MEKYKDEDERQKVTETMNLLLSPILPNLNTETAISVMRALYLLGEIDVESQERGQGMTREEMFVHLNALKHITDESSMMWLALDVAIKTLEQDPKEIYNKGFADGQKALAEHLKLCKEERRCSDDDGMDAYTLDYDDYDIDCCQ